MSKVTDQIHSSNYRGYVLLGVAALVAGILAMIIVYSAPVQSQLRSWKLLPQTEHFSELALVNPNQLPREATGAPQTFAFQVGNRESGPVTYSYIVSTTAGPVSNTLVTGSLVVEAGQTATQQVTFQLPAATKRTDIRVRLINQNQEVHFWVGATS